MPSLRNRALASIAVAVGLMSANPCGDAFAQSSSDSSEGNDQAQCMSDPVCKAHFVRARKLSKADDFDGALAAYQAAYRRREAPWLLVNMGRTLQKLGRPREAVELFQKFLASGTEDAAAKEKAQQFLKEAQQEVMNLPPSSVSSPQSTKREPSPQPAPVQPAPDSEPVQRVEPVVVVRPQPTVAPSVTKRSKWTSPLFVAGVGVGGSVALAGVVTGSLALSTASTLRNTPYLGDPGTPQLDLQQRAHALAIATDVLLPVGLLTVGAVVLATALRRHQESAAAKKTTPASLPIPSAAPASVKPEPDAATTAPHPAPDSSVAPPADANGSPGQGTAPTQGTEGAPASALPPSSAPAVSGTTSFLPSLGVRRDGFAVYVAGSF